MAGKDVPVKKYIVRLSEDERRRLEEMVRKGKSPAKRLLKARILLKVDVSELGEGWGDGEIIGAETLDPLWPPRLLRRPPQWVLGARALPINVV